MKINKRLLRSKIARAFRAFRAFHRSMWVRTEKGWAKPKMSTSFTFHPRAYYATLADSFGGQIVLSMRPYFNWKQARRAAKRIDRRAFICRGATLTRLLGV